MAHVAGRELEKIAMLALDLICRHPGVSPEEPEAYTLPEIGCHAIASDRTTGHQVRVSMVDAAITIEHHIVPSLIGTKAA